MACAEVKGRPLRWGRARNSGLGGGGAANEAKCRDCGEIGTEREVVCEGASVQGGGIVERGRRTCGGDERNA